MRLLVDTLRRLSEKGIVRPDIDPDAIADMLVGSYYSSYLRTGVQDTDLPDRIVDTLWPLIAGRPADGTPPSSDD